MSIPFTFPNSSKYKECIDSSFYKEFLSNKNGKKVFLLYGYVQSGKTNSIIEIINKWISTHKQGLIILFGGTNNLLTNQTSIRLDRNNIISFTKNTIKKNEIDFFKYQNIFLINFTKTFDSYSVLKTHLESYFNLCHDVLIIDDESDYGSVGHNDNSVFRAFLTDIWTKGKGNSKLVFVTATPFANLLNTNQKLKADFMTKININMDEYYGINEFWDKYIIIDDDTHESEALKIVYDKWSQINMSLPNSYNSELVINISPSIEEHKNVVNLIKEICITNDIGNIIQLDQDEYYASSTFENSDKKIIISGIKASRGFTFLNLYVELMLNATKSTTIDNILQKCRWFGYRKNYNHMSIFLNKPAFDLLKHSCMIIKIIDEHLEKSSNLMTTKELDLLKMQLINYENKNSIKLTNQRGE